MTRRFAVTAAGILLGSIAASSASAAITATFPNGSNFDSGDNNFAADSKGRIGSNATYTNLGESVNLTTVEIEAPLYDLSGAEPVVTSTIIKGSSATDGYHLRTNAPGTFAAIGIESQHVPNAIPFNSEHGQINYLEAWIFEFDMDVTLDQIAVSSVEAVDTFEMRVEGVGTVFSFGEVNTGSGADVYNDPFNGLVIPAGADVTFRYTTAPTVLADFQRGSRISSLTVSVVPEPAGVGLAAMGALAFLTRGAPRN